MPELTSKGLLFAPAPVLEKLPGPCYRAAVDLWFQLHQSIYLVLLPQGRVIGRNGQISETELSLPLQKIAVEHIENLLEQFAGPLIQSTLVTLAKHIAGDINSHILPPDEFLSPDDQPGTLLYLLKNPVVDGQPVSYEAAILVKQLTAACRDARWADSIAKVRALDRSEIIALNRLSYRYLGFRLEKFGEIDLDEKAVILAWVYEHFDIATGKPK